ncbi:MAG: hypothetical protein J6Y28_08175 [Acholeplasmatales bacterium]|nr:hypothetical protein [Acholeplasmatales bacterium]
MNKFFRSFPYLKPVHIHNLFERFLEITGNKVLVVYNNARDTYEMHSLKAFQLNGESLLVVLEEDMLNGWLVNDYLANNIEKFGLEVQSERLLANEVLDKYEDRGFDLLTKRTLKTVETIIGREI